TSRCGLLAAFAMLVASAAARADAPVVGPQWTMPFWRDVPAFDPMASSNDPTWLHEPGGATALFTASGLLFRRFDAGGAVVGFSFLSHEEAGIPAIDIGDIVVKPDPVDGGFH